MSKRVHSSTEIEPDIVHGTSIKAARPSTGDDWLRFPVNAFWSIVMYCKRSCGIFYVLT